jgi:xylulose-5-phosphate/fructose-6-phosphate phosphoketolase
MDVIRRVPHLETAYAALSQRMDDERIAHRVHTRQFGEDMADVSGAEGLPFADPNRQTAIDTGDDNA